MLVGPAAPRPVSRSSPGVQVQYRRKNVEEALDWLMKYSPVFSAGQWRGAIHSHTLLWSRSSGDDDSNGLVLEGVEDSNDTEDDILPPLDYGPPLDHGVLLPVHNVCICRL